MHDRILSGLAVAALVGTSILQSGATLTSPAAQPLTALQTTPLDKDAFWALIDRSAADGAGSPAQLDTLRAGLMRLSADQIVHFHRQFVAAMRDANRWELWGAAYVAGSPRPDSSTIRSSPAPAAIRPIRPIRSAACGTDRSGWKVT